MTFDIFINTARQYSQYLGQEKRESDFRLTVKDNFMNLWLAYKVKNPQHSNALYERIAALFPKAAEKIMDWNAKGTVGNAVLEAIPESVISAAQAFDEGHTAMKADPAFKNYRTARKELKEAVKALGKAGHSKEEMLQQLNTAGLSSIAGKVDQLYKYVKKAPKA